MNTIPLIVASYRHALVSVLGVESEPAEARGWIGQTLSDTFASRYPDRANELIDSYVTWNAAHLDELLEDFPGTPEMLATLLDAGAILGVATSKRRSSAVNTLRAAGLADQLTVTVAMEDTLAHKPSPEPLLLALQRLGSKAGEAVYIGDAVVDVQAARAAGMAAIAVTWGAGAKPALAAARPFAVVESVAELLAVLLP